MANLEQVIEALGGEDGAALGGDWGGIMTRDEFLSRITRVAMPNNALLIEVQLPGDGLGVYNLAEASKADKFL